MTTNYKIILCGDYSIGKSSIVHRLLKDEFHNFAESTIGASYSAWSYIHTNSNTVARFGIWDTAGQERYSSLLPIYLRDTQAVLYCWEYLTDFDTFLADKMYNKVMDYSPKSHFYLVITKIDLSNFDTIYWESVEKWAKDKNIKGCYYTSALNGKGIKDLFSTVATNLLSFQTNLNKNILTLDIENKKNVKTNSKCC